LQGDAFVKPHLLESIQKVGAARYVSFWDARTGYWQLGMRHLLWMSARTEQNAIWVEIIRKFFLSLRSDDHSKPIRDLFLVC
jgi:hypothetical protein